MSPLELLLQSFEAFGNMDPIMKLLARTGRRWQTAPLPTSVKRGKLGMCYPQARALALKFPEKYFYVEGYACTESAVMPIHHAWCSTDSGQVIDPTWERPERAVYIGAAFKPCAFDEPLPDFLAWGLLRSPEFLKKVQRDPERYIEMAWYRTGDAMRKAA